MVGFGSSLIVGWSAVEVGSYFKTPTLVMGKQLFCAVSDLYWLRDIELEMPY